MKLVVTGRDLAMRPILEHEKTAEIVDAAQGPVLRGFLMNVIRDFHRAADLTQRKPNLRKLAGVHVRSKGDRKSADRICSAIESLYREFDPSNVRGALLEAMIQRAIQSRYGRGEDLLDNNIEFKVERDGATHETSTSVDVVGLDAEQEIGECHDCKVGAKGFDLAWLAELRDNLAPIGFRVGIATADSEQRARRALENLGFTLDATTILVTEDTWPLPLQP